MAIKMQQRRGTAAQWTAANPVLGSGELGYETDTNYFKLGDGVSAWTALPYFKNITGVNGSIETYIGAEVTNRNDAITAAIATEVTNRNNAVTSAISTEVTNRNSAITSAISTEITDRNSAIATAKSEAGTIASGYVSTHNSATTNVHGISDTSALVTTTQLALKAPLAGPTFTGTVVLPSTTSIGNVSSTEIGYVDGVTSAIQTQLDAKLGTSTAASTYLGLAGGTLTGPLTLSGAPTSDLHAATKLYVDGLAAGINFHQAVKATTTTNLSANYSNGTNGLGATLTADTNRAFTTLDGVSSWSLGDRVLIKDQTDAKQNGIYTLTTIGSVSAPWVLTRAVDADNNPSGELATGDFCFVTSGTANGSKGFILSTTGTITLGTTNVAYTQFNASEAITAGTNISKSGSTVSVIDAPTFSGLVTASSGVAFSDGTQTKQGVPSLTTINQQAGAYTVVLTDRDKLVEVNSASGVTVTIPTNASVAYPVGTSIDILQTGSGQVTIAAATPGTTTVNATPGLKLRTQWSSATLFKRATDTWVVYGDLTA
jgi:hypothetical protein